MKARFMALALLLLGVVVLLAPLHLPYSFYTLQRWRVVNAYKEAAAAGLVPTPQPGPKSLLTHGRCGMEHAPTCIRVISTNGMHYDYFVDTSKSPWNFQLRRSFDPRAPRAAHP